MIEGLPIEKIESNDFYRRFEVFKLLLRKSKVAQEGQMEGKRRIDQVEKDLQTFEQTISEKNLHSSGKVSETMLRIDKLCSDLGEIMPRVQVKKDAFEGDLLRRWRNILNLKKKNEDESQKQKDEKSTSNKNLMFLTSELLKKERVSTRNLNSHQKRIEDIQNDIEARILEARREFDQKHQKIRLILKNEKNRVANILDEYAFSLQEQRTNYLQQLKRKIEFIRLQLKKDIQTFTANSKGIQQILSTVRSKVSDVRYPK